MRNKYKVFRARDGSLIVEQSKPGRRRRWPLVGVGLALVAVAMFDLSALLSPFTGLPASVAGLFSGPVTETESSKPDTVSFKLPLELRTQQPNTAPPVSSLKPAPAAIDSPYQAADKAIAEQIPAAAETVALVPEVGTTTLDNTSEITTTSSTSVAELQKPEPVVVKVKSGDSLYTIFNALGLSQAEMYQVTRGEGKQLTRLHPGQTLKFLIDNDGALEKLVYQVDAVNSVHFKRAASGFAAEHVEEPYDVRVTASQGEIASSLFLSAQSAGLSDRVIMSLVEIFGWDVDFALDIRRGDQFSVIYEELYKDGVKVRDGAILAADFVNQGKRIRALRYTDAQGRSNYFSPNGDSMRKAFIRTPVDIGRISSHFNPNRKHPVLNTIRAHKGVDYAAPRGTPIKATGDGKITFLGRKGGYGKTIVIRHGGTYTTLYAHMNGYAKGMRTGKSVRQGQIIGYVGATGLATGPHLHYEFRIHGVHRNPVKVELPKASPISPEYKQDFLASTQSLVARLDYLSRTQIAGQMTAQ